MARVIAARCATATRADKCGHVFLPAPPPLRALRQREGAFDLPLKVFKEVGPARGMLWFDETASVCAVI